MGCLWYCSKYIGQKLGCRSKKLVHNTETDPTFGSKSFSLSFAENLIDYITYYTIVV